MKANGRSHAQRSGGEVVGQPGINANVGKMYAIRCIYNDIAGNTAEPPVILIFQVVLRRPLHDHEGNVIGSNARRAGDIELIGESTIGAVSDGLPVHPYVQDALRTTDVQHDALVSPVGRNHEAATMDAGWVPLGDLGRAAPVGHLHIGVMRIVPALHGPVPGKFNRLPTRRVAGDVPHHDRRRIFRIGKRPRAVQAERLGCVARRAHRQPMKADGLWLGPRRWSKGIES